MRLWHSKLVPLLDGRRLCDLHMSCCNLRGLGWGKRNAAVGYLYDDPLGEDALAVYHHRVLKEMEHRGYKFDPLWVEASYCGKKRPRRACSWKNYKEACLRNIPLEGHTSEIYKNDVKALQERGLDIDIERKYDSDDDGPYLIYKASVGDRETFYGIRL